MGLTALGKLFGRDLTVSWRINTKKFIIGLKEDFKKGLKNNYAGKLIV